MHCITEHSISKEYLEKLYKEQCYIDKKTGYYRFKENHKFVHRWIMEQIEHRKLTRTEVVHHINGNKLDNDPTNLLLFENQQDHFEWHQKNNYLSGVW